MPYTSSTWPIGALMLNFAGVPGGDGQGDGWRRDLREVAMAGFSHVDIMDSWVRPADLTRDERRDLVTAASELGLAYSTICVARQSIIAADSDQAARNLDYSLRTVEAAAEMGVSTLCLGLHQPLTPAQQGAVWFWLEPGEEDPDDPTVWDLAVERLRTVGERAASYGMQLSLEMYEGTYLGTSASAVRLVTDIGLDNVGLCPDMGNIVRLHRPVERWQDMITAMAPYANYWQTKNYARDHDPATGAYFSTPATMESGYIDYRSAIGIALAAGYQGPFGVENYGGDGLSVSATNREYLRRILAAKLGE
jgi:sugar phosphate isomerase/epimerase